MTPMHDSSKHDSSQHESIRAVSQENADPSEVLVDGPVRSIRVIVSKLVPAAPRAVPGRGVFVSGTDCNPDRSNIPTFPTLRSGLSAGSYNIL
jgi:hypothetical protein